MEQARFILDMLATKKLAEEAEEAWKSGNRDLFNSKIDERKTQIATLVAAAGITVSKGGGRNIGRCYNQYFFCVHSPFPLNRELVTIMRDAGMVGYGQEFHVNESVYDETTKSYATDVINTVDSSD